jgi:hypothetical protein
MSGEKTLSGSNTASRLFNCSNKKVSFDCSRQETASSSDMRANKSVVSSFILICRGEIRPPGVVGGEFLLSSSEIIPNPPLFGIFDPGRNGLNPPKSFESPLASSSEKSGEFAFAVEEGDFVLRFLRWGDRTTYAANIGRADIEHGAIPVRRVKSRHLLDGDILHLFRWIIGAASCHGRRLFLSASPSSAFFGGNSYYLPLFFWPSSSIAFSSRQIIYLFSRHLFLSFVSQLNSFFLLFPETSVSLSNILSFL